MSAAAEGHLQVVQELLAANAATGLETASGMTALACAERAGHEEVAELIRGAHATGEARRGK